MRKLRKFRETSPHSTSKTPGPCAAKNNSPRISLFGEPSLAWGFCGPRYSRRRMVRARRPGTAEYRGLDGISSITVTRGNTEFRKFRSPRIFPRTSKRQIQKWQNRNIQLGTRWRECGVLGGEGCNFGNPRDVRAGGGQWSGNSGKHGLGEISSIAIKRGIRKSRELRSKSIPPSTSKTADPKIGQSKYRISELGGGHTALEGKRIAGRNFGNPGLPAAAGSDHGNQEIAT